jgi:hypothetical protein
MASMADAMNSFLSENKVVKNGMCPAYYLHIYFRAHQCTRAQKNYFRSTQHPLNMAGVSKRREKIFNSIVSSSTFTVTNALVNTKLPYQLC